MLTLVDRAVNFIYCQSLLDKPQHLALEQRRNSTCLFGNGMVVRVELNNVGDFTHEPDVLFSSFGLYKQTPTHLRRKRTRWPWIHFSLCPTPLARHWPAQIFGAWAVLWCPESMAAGSERRIDSLLLLSPDIITNAVTERQLKKRGIKPTIIKW